MAGRASAPAAMHRRGSFSAALAVSICSGIIAVLHGSLGANYEALGLVYLPAVIGVAFLFGLRAGILTASRRRRCSTPCCCPRRASRHPTRASGCCSPRCSSPASAVAELAARERRRSEQAYEREREAALLAGLSSALVGGASLELAQVDAARVGGRGDRRAGRAHRARPRAAGRARWRCRWTSTAA